MKSKKKWLNCYDNNESGDNDNDGDKDDNDNNNCFYN
jgi:hypothetical protein